MRAWRVVRGAGQVLHTLIVLRLVDDVTGGGPLGRVEFALDRQDGARWVEIGDAKPVYASSGIVAWPGLGRALDPAGSPVVRYRVRLVDPDGLNLYQPEYAAQIDGLEFDVAPWNDDHPPAVAPDRPERVHLFPGIAYPFPGTTSVLRGRAVDSGGQPLANALITEQLTRVVTNGDGLFALPIRLTAPANSVVVVGEHFRSGASGDATVPLPAGLRSNLELQLV